jgi:hypothetical protein
LKLKTEPGGAVPLYSGLGISDVTQESPLDIAALTNVDPKHPVKDTVDARSTRRMRSNGNGSQGEIIFSRKRHKGLRFILSHYRDGEGPAGEIALLAWVNGEQERDKLGYVGFDVGKFGLPASTERVESIG